MQLRNTFAMTDSARNGRRARLLRGGIAGIAAYSVACLSTTFAYAVSDNVKHACRDDYFQHCSQYAVGSEELRQCMRKVGEDLSTPCLVALVQEGEITKADVDRHNAAKAGGAKSADSKKNAPQVASENTGDPKDVGTKSAKTTKAGKKKKKQKVTAEDAPSAAGKTKSKAGETSTEKSAKATKSHKAAAAANPAKKSGKKKGSKSAKSTNASATAASGTTPVAKASAAKGKKSNSGATVKSGKKKQTGGTAVKAKKTSKKKSSGAAAKKVS
jgi:hypothetical protein